MAYVFDLKLRSFEEGMQESLYLTRGDFIEGCKLLLDGQPSLEEPFKEGCDPADFLRQLILNRAKLLAKSEKDERSPVGAVLRHNYLAKSFSRSTAIRCHLQHYYFLSKTIPGAIAELISGDLFVVYRCQPGSIAYECVLTMPRHDRREGELSLVFCADDLPLYELDFTFVPGDVLSLKTHFAILISLMQGKANSFEAIRRATKEIHDVSPQAILFAVLRGIAKGLGLEHIVGVCSTNQAAYVGDGAKLFENVYDRFFASIGATGPTDGFFYTSADSVEKPINLVAAGHRLRTKIKRGVKADIFNSVARSWPTIFGATDWLASGKAGARLPYEPRQRASSPRQMRIPNDYLGVELGERKRSGAIAATGTKGCLCFGPYIRVEAGAYEVSYEFSRLDRPSGIRVDVVAHSANVVIASELVDPRHIRNHRFDLEFKTDRDHYDMEFRVFVAENTSLELKRISLRRLSSAAIFLGKVVKQLATAAALVRIRPTS